MTEQEQIQYLANIYHLAQVDGQVDRIEDKLLDEMAKGIGAGYFEIVKAKALTEKEDFSIQYPSRLSDQIRNLEDMLLLAYSDQKLHHLEKKIILEYADNLGLTKKQSALVQQQAQSRLKTLKK